MVSSEIEVHVFGRTRRRKEHCEPRSERGIEGSDRESEKETMRTSSSSLSHSLCIALSLLLSFFLSLSLSVWSVLLAFDSRD